MKKVKYYIIFILFLFFNSFVKAQPVQGTCEVMFNNCEQDLVNFLNENIGANNCLQWGSVCGSGHGIFRFGKVGLGTSVVPSGSILGVKGSMITNEMRIELCETSGWCDYVFEANYPLLTLPQLALFIQENGHLPNTPSAKEIESEGSLDVKAVKLNQQEKVEEIFLYLIQIQERVENLKEEIAKLEKENELLRKAK